VRSLRRTLVLTLLGAVMAVTLAGALATYRQARDGIDQIFDYHLRQLALSLRDQSMGRVEPGGAGQPEERFDFVIQVWNRDGERVYVSRLGTGLPEVARLGFTTVAAPSGDWRVYSAALGAQVIQVAQQQAVRDRLALDAALRTLAPLLVLLPLLALLVWRVVGHGLAPLDRLARGVAARTPSTLEPLSEAGVPTEVLPLVLSLNALLGRLRLSLAAQKALVADAAHELRTPLAALKLQVQLAQRASDGESRSTALGEVSAGLERATHVVQQLLLLARQEPEAPAAERSDAISLADLTGQAVADLAPFAEARRVDLGVTAADELAIVHGDASALRALLVNLVDNAIRYTPEGGRVDVSAGVEAGRPFLEVADTGPGIPAADRERVFDRFYRRGGTAEPGTGLGLAIVKAIASRQRAEVVLADAVGGGLVARVRFPPDGERLGDQSHGAGPLSRP
jgi:two-component system OmpR family sensor kinase